MLTAPQRSLPVRPLAVWAGGFAWGSGQHNAKSERQAVERIAEAIGHGFAKKDGGSNACRALGRDHV